MNGSKAKRKSFAGFVCIILLFTQVFDIGVNRMLLQLLFKLFSELNPNLGWWIKLNLIEPTNDSQVFERDKMGEAHPASFGSVYPAWIQGIVIPRLPGLWAYGIEKSWRDTVESFQFFLRFSIFPRSWFLWNAFCDSFHSCGMNLPLLTFCQMLILLTESFLARFGSVSTAQVTSVQCNQVSFSHSFRPWDEVYINKPL